MERADKEGLSRPKSGVKLCEDRSDPQKLDDRENRIARFLVEHKVPDRFLAVAIDRLSRNVDDKTLGLVFIDYKSLKVRHLGSIYEELLEFRLKIADDDLTTTTEKKKEKYIPLTLHSSQIRKFLYRKSLGEVVTRSPRLSPSNRCSTTRGQCHS